ncbi:uncharacterized protein N7503_001924 [Penicillium pulvis]|uniref:uncharacterized protein n=1 Tax=Penicillium pulvis TaxID=1562058 RepID=UPI002547D8F6|nr:uncharacterized protein N7503_001924 [Penicillium pulvis]KAJ5809706.1 hypothetical protein N7503_001924 [Penicillium pulvis]
MDDIPGSRMPKACRTCAKAKVRCEPEPNGVCKRCKRLKKECNGQTPGSHRRTKAAKENLEVSALEAKLDRMVELLAASEKSRDAQSNTSHSPEHSSTYPDEDSASPDGQDDEAYMDVLRKSIMPLFPFIAIPAHLTADQLRREKPFLHLNITMVTCQHAPRQREIAEMVKQYAAEHIVLKGEHSLDLLQGLLLYLSWFITIAPLPRWQYEQSANPENGPVGPHIQPQISAQLDVYMQLAIAQVISLNLNQGIASLRSLDRPLSYLRAFDFHPHLIPARTLEERRIYLGCYYISVLLSICVREMEPVRFTKYTDECCEELTKAMEFPTDAYLVQLIRVVHLGDKVHRTTPIKELGPSAVVSTPLGLIVRGHQAELQQLKTSFSCESPQSGILSLHYQTVEIIIYRICLSEDVSDTQYGDYSTTRLDLLFRCLEAVKSFVYDIHSLPVDLFPFFPFTIWCQFGLTMVTLSRLTLFQGEKIGWDRNYVRSTIDIEQIADMLTKKMKDALTLHLEKNLHKQGASEPPEIFERLIPRLQVFNAVHRMRAEAQEKANIQAPLETLDFSFMLNMPVDVLFPYGHYGEIPGAFDPPSLPPSLDPSLAPNLAPSAIRALQKWPDMAEENERISFEPWISWHKITGEMISGPKPLELNTSEDTAGDQNSQPPKIYRHSRPRMHKMLSDQIERAGITLEYSKQVVEYYENMGPSTAGVFLESGERLEADVVIAADGIGSTSSRITLGHEVRARPTGFSIYRASCPIDPALTNPVFEERFPILDNDRPSAQLWMGDNVHALFGRTQDEISWYLTYPNREDSTESWSKLVDPDAVLQNTATIEGWPEYANQLIRATPRDRIHDFKLMWREPQPCWASSTGRIIQIGDAAHTFLPSSGNGATQGMEDAISLATCLQIAGKENLSWATRVHNKLRFERVACLQLLGVLNHEMRQRSSDAKTSQAKPVGLLGTWIWQHDPEQYAIANYSKALANLDIGSPFDNTNIPAGYVYQPWTIDELLKSMEVGEEIVLKGNWE